MKNIIKRVIATPSFGLTAARDPFSLAEPSDGEGTAASTDKRKKKQGKKRANHERIKQNKKERSKARKKNK